MTIKSPLTHTVTPFQFEVYFGEGPAAILIHSVFQDLNMYFPSIKLSHKSREKIIHVQTLSTFLLSQLHLLLLLYKYPLQ